MLLLTADLWGRIAEWLPVNTAVRGLCRFLRSQLPDETLRTNQLLFRTPPPTRRLLLLLAAGGPPVNVHTVGGSARGRPCRGPCFDCDEGYSDDEGRFNPYRVRRHSTGRQLPDDHAAWLGLETLIVDATDARRTFTERDHVYHWMHFAAPLRLPNVRRLWFLAPRAQPLTLVTQERYLVNNGRALQTTARGAYTMDLWVHAAAQLLACAPAVAECRFEFGNNYLKPPFLEPLASTLRWQVPVVLPLLGSATDPDGAGPVTHHTPSSVTVGLRQDGLDTPPDRRIVRDDRGDRIQRLQWCQVAAVLTPSLLAGHFRRCHLDLRGVSNTKHVRTPRSLLRQQAGTVTRSAPHGDAPGADSEVTVHDGSGLVTLRRYHSEDGGVLRTILHVVGSTKRKRQPTEGLNDGDGGGAVEG